MLRGKETILIVQPVNDTNGALAIANLTENSYSIENGILDEQTKLGRIVGYGENSESFEMTAYGKRDDEGQQAVLDAIKNKEKLKVWETDTVQNASGNYDASFAYCVVESAEKSNPTDSFQEVTATLQVDGETQPGELTSLPAGATDTSSYSFETPTTA
jgi:TP901-1 family phage major tail protein